jgi:hypothetical protein
MSGSDAFHDDKVRDDATYRERAASGSVLQGRRGSSAVDAQSGTGSSQGAPPPQPLSSDLYVCKGGRSFTVDESVRDPVTWYVAVSNCATLYGLDLSYVLEIHGQVGECPQTTRRRQPFVDAGSAGGGSGSAAAAAVRPTANTRGRQLFADPAAASTPGKALLTAREASVVVQQQKGDGSDLIVGTSGDDVTQSNSRRPTPCVLEGSVNTSLNWFGFFANLTLRGGNEDDYVDGSEEDADGGGVSSGSSDNGPGWFRYTFTYPYDMQIQEVLLYDTDDLPKLHFEQDCAQKTLIIPSKLVHEKILELSYR